MMNKSTKALFYKDFLEIKNSYGTNILMLIITILSYILNNFYLLLILFLVYGAKGSQGIQLEELSNYFKTIFSFPITRTQYIKEKHVINLIGILVPSLIFISLFILNILIGRSNKVGLNILYNAISFSLIYSAINTFIHSISSSTSKYGTLLTLIVNMPIVLV